MGRIRWTWAITVLNVVLTIGYTSVTPAYAVACSANCGRFGGLKTCGCTGAGAGCEANDGEGCSAWNDAGCVDNKTCDGN